MDKHKATQLFLGPMTTTWVELPKSAPSAVLLPVNHILITSTKLLLIWIENKNCLISCVETRSVSLKMCVESILFPFIDPNNFALERDINEINILK